MNWVCPYCQQSVSGMDEEELLVQINLHLEKHRPFMQKLMDMISGKKKKTQEVEKVI